MVYISLIFFTSYPFWLQYSSFDFLYVYFIQINHKNNFFLKNMGLHV